MSYKQRKQRRNNLYMEQQTCQIIGLLDQKITLICQVNPQFQTHKFIYSLSHPLQCITMLIQKRKKQIFQKLLLCSDLHRIELQNVFLPKQLLSGNQDIMSKFKRKLQTTKINSYIKLNFLDTKTDFTHKRSQSCELTAQNLNSKSSKIESKSLYKRFESNNHNINIRKQNKKQIYAQNSSKQNRSTYSNLREINKQNMYTKTVINNDLKKQKSRQKVKSKPTNINVSYTIIQNNLQNPESLSIYEKAFTSNDKVYKQRKNNIDLYEKSLRVPSTTTHNKNGRSQNNLIATFHDQVLSERMNRSIKNSQASELTHQQNEVFYYSKQKRYQKKDRKVFQVERNC